MNNYTIYCTEEQAKKALELGAPIKLYSEEHDNSNIKDNEYYITNDIIFMNNENICRNEECDLVCIIGERPNRKAYFVPTAEQMISWLEEQEEISDLHIFKPAIRWTFELYASNGDGKNNHPLFNSRKEATLAAIDAALDYLSKNKK